ncbi:MAG: gliding motility protein GldN [Mucilaginibacter polytrichastri]|nr:gliding motility protein GldN [Mucilaginibacter polytrichastri]
MKKAIVLFLCLACLGAQAQTRRKAPAKKKAPVAQKAQQPAAPDQSLVDVPKADTGKKIALDRPTDGYFKKSSVTNAKVTPYAYLRDADVMFSKRIWREIDTREKMNWFLSSPKARLIDVLMTAIQDGELTAYDASPTKEDPNGDSFTQVLTPGQAMGKFADSVVVDQFDQNTGEKTGSQLMAGEFNPDSVVKFRIKEDWIFDKQRSVFEPRIIGIAPMVKPKAGGVDLDYQPAFWIYFPEARQLLSTKEAVNRNNDATGLSFDDVFVKRLFASYIVKESNDKDERIKDYAQGVDRLYESDRIKKTLMDFEHDLWSY